MVDIINRSVIEVDSKEANISVLNPANAKDLRNFSFDHTYDWKSTQELIFSQTAQPILESVMEGYNGTIFAYGQTGTGKTFTMEGVPTPELKGIIPRTIEWIFNNIKNYSNRQFLVRASFIEIYNEEARDLLSKNVKSK